jgi:hypothetical protein
MDTKVCSLIFLFVSFVYGTLNCNYSEGNFYKCELTIDNPTGLDNFTEITGNHIDPYDESFVEEIQAASGSKSTNIPEIICNTFDSVKTISLASIGLETIGENSLKKCTRIKKIFLIGNEIKTVNGLAFSGKPLLDTLDLSRNKISDLPDETFSLVKSLKKLDLSGNEIVNPKWFGNLGKIQELYLNNNKIIDLAAGTFGSSDFLTYLSLANNGLTTIKSESFGALPNLATIDLQHNKINEIDEQFINNSGVETLNANGNVCVDKDIEGRKYIIYELSVCFQNYQYLFSKLTYFFEKLSILRLNFLNNFNY